MVLDTIDAAHKITASKSYQEIFSNLSEYLIDTGMCKSIKFLIFRSKGMLHIRMPEST